MDVINQQNSFVGCKCWQSSMPLKQPERFEPESQLLVSCSPRMSKPAFTAFSNRITRLEFVGHLTSGLHNFFPVWLSLKRQQLVMDASSAMAGFSTSLALLTSCNISVPLSERTFKNIKASKLWPDLFAKSSCSCFSTGAFCEQKGRKIRKVHGSSALKFRNGKFLTKFRHLLRLWCDGLWLPWQNMRDLGLPQRIVTDHQPHPGLRASGAAIKRRTRAGNRRTNLCTLLHLFSAISSLSTKSYIHILRPVAQNLHFIHVFSCSHHPFDSFFAPSLQFL